MDSSTRPTAEIVSHCWQYSRLLTYQLSGFVLHPPANCNLTVTVFHAAEDDDTRRTLDFFAALSPPRVTWNFLAIERPRLMRRAIGRNLACKATAADWVLMTDCDYVFGAGAIDLIVDGLRFAGQSVLGHVREHSASTSQADGDAEIERVTGPDVVGVDPSRYSPSRLARAIGGSQFVPGDWARVRGYLPNSRRFQRPAGEWQRTFEDTSFRRTCGLPQFAIDCPAMYRIRHSQRGRFQRGVKL